jgi:hypothetical protein
MSEKKQIAKAIIAVMQAVKGMEKNSKVGDGNHSYNGTKDQDVKEVFNEALAKNGLCIMPIDLEEQTQVDRWEDAYKKPKQSIFTKVKVKYLLLHDSGESIELVGYGHGIDTQDKGAGKATTYALKNCLLYTFLTPVGKIDDAETTHSNDLPIAQTKEQIEAEIRVNKIKECISLIEKCDTLDSLEKTFLSFDVEFRKVKAIADKTTEIKEKLTTKK